MSARVKSVVSGDTLVLVDKQTSQEVQVSLAYVATPRMTEPWGFDAREYLRNLVLAKPVAYRLLYNVNNREYGDISSPIFKSLIEHMLLQGWTKLRDDAESKAGFSEYGPRLIEAQTQAQSRGVGLWTDKKWTPLNIRPVVPESLYGSGRQIPAIVERVISGDRVIIRAMMDPDDHYVGTAMLAGIRTHRTTSSPSNPSSTTAAVAGDAFGDAAAEALSTRLLQRSQVRAVFVVPSKNNPDIPLVTLQHPQGDIALLLVRSGLAEVPNVPEIGTERLLQLRNAQIEAQGKGVGLYRAAALARKQHSEKHANDLTEGVVIKVLSSDMVVLDPSSKTVQLSSTRAPRRNDNPAHAANAREFARKLLIGQHVRIQIDGETSFPNSTEEPRPVVTLSYGPQYAHNAALEIIRAGWATALRHRRDDLSRSPFYAELLAAEESAEAAKKGIFAPPPKNKSQAAAAQIVDASESMVRARGYLASLERKGKISAVVENVISAGRLRLSVPSENCTLVAVLDGVKVPRASEPYAAEALAYTMREWNQRDVHISVRSVDKTGAFVSTIYKKSKSLALELLSNGFASIHEGSANASGLRQVYDDVQEEARSNRKGMWKDYEEPVDMVTSRVDDLYVGENNSNASEDASQSTYSDAVISSVSLDMIHIRLAADEAKFQQQTADLRKFFTAVQNASARSFTQKPRRREMVVIANTYERGIITAIIPSKSGGSSMYELDLVDSGNVLTLSASEFYPTPKEFSSTGPLARPLTLRYVHKPVKFYEQPYLDYLSKFVNSPVVVIGDIVFTADSANGTDSLNTRIVAQGLASVPIAQANEEGAQPALKAQDEVKSSRRGMWEYGDPREDEDL